MTTAETIAEEYKVGKATVEQKTYLIGKKYKKEKQQHGGDRKSRGQNVHLKSLACSYVEGEQSATSDRFEIALCLACTYVEGELNCRGATTIYLFHDLTMDWGHANFV